jgi:threonine-phosphate decarboxylase
MPKFHGDNIYEIAQQLNLKPDEIMDFSAAINPLGLSSKAKRKMVKEGLAAVLHNPDAQCSELKRTLAQFHGLQEDQILAGSGPTEFIYAVSRVLKIRRALIVTPAFSECENALEMCGQDLRIDFFESREEDGFELRTEGLLAAMAQGYDVLYLANPNNSTGILTEKKDLLRILQRAEQEKTWFILDEAFIDFIEEESLKAAALSSSRLIILRSLMKFYALPGLRAGYMISSPEVIRSFSLEKEPWTVNAMAQIAGSESVKDSRYIVRTQKLIRLERERLIGGLRTIPGFIPYPSRANFLLVQLHPGLNLTAGELRRKLIPHRFLIRDCRSFHHMGSFFFRIAVLRREENQALLKALQRIRKEIG